MKYVRPTRKCGSCGSMHTPKPLDFEECVQTTMVEAKRSLEENPKYGLVEEIYCDISVYFGLDMLDFHDGWSNQDFCRRIRDEVLERLGLKND